MEYRTIILEVSDFIASVTLNRPEQLNALNAEMAEELLDAMTRLGNESNVRAIIITGAGRAFAAGKDLKENLSVADEEKVPSDWPERACRLLRSIDKPIIAAINGAAVGFGCALCLACDIRIASESARIGMGFVRVGVSPGFGSSYFLPRLVGLGKACELAFADRIIDAGEAERIGMVNKVVADSELRQASWEFARSLAEAAPVAMQLTKRAIYQGMQSGLDSQLKLEPAFQVAAIGTEDHREAMKSFLEKRKPVFTGK
ncbi:MAG: enoyl-CoA hydratase [Betaproteobacteria bacterium]|nr:enoyl-CoA hydratase [Betaproteobacteria bacterium]